MTPLCRDKLTAGIIECIEKITAKITLYALQNQQYLYYGKVLSKRRISVKIQPMKMGFSQYDGSRNYQIFTAFSN